MELAKEIRPSSPSQPLDDACLPEVAVVTVPSAAESALEMFFALGCVALGFFSARRLLRLGRGVGHRRARSAFLSPEKNVEDKCSASGFAGGAESSTRLDGLQLKAHNAYNRCATLHHSEGSDTAWLPGDVWVPKDTTEDDDTMSPSGCSDDMVDAAVFAQEDSEVADLYDRWLDGVFSLETKEMSQPEDFDCTQELVAPASPLAAARADLQQQPANLQQNPSAEAPPGEDESSGPQMQGAGFSFGMLWRISLL